MAEKNNARAITRVELLVHPFYDLYLSSREICLIGLPPFSYEELADKAEKWKRRAEEIKNDPNAILIIVRSGFEKGHPATRFGEAVFGRRFRGHGEEEIARIRKLEEEFYNFVGKRVPRERLFTGMERSNFRRPRSIYDYALDIGKFKKELKGRNLQLGPELLVEAYGTYTSHCTKNEFLRFCKRFSRLCRISRKSRVVRELSLPKGDPPKRETRWRGRRFRKPIRFGSARTERKRK